MRYDEEQQKWFPTFEAGQVVQWNKTYAPEPIICTVLDAKVTDDGQGYERVRVQLQDGKKKWLDAHNVKLYRKMPMLLAAKALLEAAQHLSELPDWMYEEIVEQIDFLPTGGELISLADWLVSEAKNA